MASIHSPVVDMSRSKKVAQGRAALDAFRERKNGANVSSPASILRKSSAKSPRAASLTSARRGLDSAPSSSRITPYTLSPSSQDENRTGDDITAALMSPPPGAAYTTELEATRSPPQETAAALRARFSKSGITRYLEASASKRVTFDETSRAGDEENSAPQAMRATLGMSASRVSQLRDLLDTALSPASPTYIPSSELFLSPTHTPGATSRKPLPSLDTLRTPVAAGPPRDDEYTPVTPFMRTVTGASEDLASLKQRLQAAITSSGGAPTHTLMDAYARYCDALAGAVKAQSDGGQEASRAQDTIAALRSELEAVTSECSRLREETAFSAAQVTQMQAKMDLQQSKEGEVVSSLRAQLRESADALNAQRSIADAARVEVQTLLQRLISARASADESATIARAAEVATRESDARATAADGRAAAAEQRAASAEQRAREAEMVRDSVRSSVAAAHDADGRATAAEARAAAADTRASAAENRAAAAEEAQHTIRARMRVMEVAHDTAAREYASSLSTLESQLAAAVAAADGRSSDAQAHIATLSEQLEGVTASRDAIEAKLRDALSLLAAAHSEIQSHEVSLMQAVARADAAEEAASTSCSALREETARCAAAAAYVDEVVLDRERARVRAEASEMAAEQVRAELAVLQEAHDVLQASRDQLEIDSTARIQELSDAIEHAAQEREAIEARAAQDVGHMQQQVTEVSNAHAHASERVTELESVITTLNGQLADVTARLHSITSRPLSEAQVQTDSAVVTDMQIQTDVLELPVEVPAATIAAPSMAALHEDMASELQLSHVAVSEPCHAELGAYTTHAQGVDTLVLPHDAVRVIKRVNVSRNGSVQVVYGSPGSATPSHANESTMLSDGGDACDVTADVSICASARPITEALPSTLALSHPPRAEPLLVSQVARVEEAPADVASAAQARAIDYHALACAARVRARKEVSSSSGAGAARAHVAAVVGHATAPAAPVVQRCTRVVEDAATPVRARASAEWMDLPAASAFTATRTLARMGMQ